MDPLEVARSHDRLAPDRGREDFPQENGVAQHEWAIAYLICQRP